MTLRGSPPAGSRLPAQDSHTPRSSQVRTFVSFDTAHDIDLCALLRSQSELPGSGFLVTAVSKRPTPSDAEGERLRRSIREAGQVIVICGEHTGESMEVSMELRIANEELTPYFLLWGRPKIMCTKPIGARKDEGMYGWTLPILQAQIAITARRGRKPPA